MIVDRDAFEGWLAHPVTEIMLKRCSELAEQAKTEWIAMSWDGGSADDRILQRLRGRAEAYSELSNVDQELLEADHDDETRTYTD